MFTIKIIRNNSKLYSQFLYSLVNGQEKRTSKYALTFEINNIPTIYNCPKQTANVRKGLDIYRIARKQKIL